MMEYKIKENIYQKQNSFFNKAVSGLTGLALLTNTLFSSGCVDNINGISVEPLRKVFQYSGKRKAGNDKMPPSTPPDVTTVTVPVAGLASAKPKDDEDNPWVVAGGILLGCAIIGGVGYGSYELYKLFDKDKDDDLPIPPLVGGGNGGGGPGGGGTGGN